MPKSREQIGQYLTAYDSYTTTLMTILTDVYGTECFSWSPETLQMELVDDFRVRLPQFTLDRILTGIALLTTDDFYHSLPDFVQFCNVLSGDLYNPELWDPATAGEIAWGLTEALLLSPPEEDDANPFSEEITAYIGHVLDDEGIITPPDILRIAVRTVEPSAVVAGAFADDPGMLHSIYELQHSKTDSIDEAVTHGLRQLLGQLAALPLENGNADAVKKMITTLGQQ